MLTWSSVVLPLVMGDGLCQLALGFNARPPNTLTSPPLTLRLLWIVSVSFMLLIELLSNSSQASHSLI